MRADDKKIQTINAFVEDGQLMFALDLLKTLFLDETEQLNARISEQSQEIVSLRRDVSAAFKHTGHSFEKLASAPMCR